MTAVVAGGRAPPLGAAGGPAPGSLFWLVRHELRLALRDAPSGRWRRLVILAVVLLLPTLAGVALAWGARDVPDVPAGAIGFVAAAAIALVVLLLSGASVYVLRRFHDRADLDLLLSAPVPPARIFAAKAVAVQVSVAMPVLVLVSPFLIASAMFGHPGWLGGIVVIASAAVIATSLAFMLSAGLFRLVGPRRGRIIIQVASGGFAALVAVGGQTPNFAPRFFAGIRDALRPAPAPPFDWPARAAFGELLPLLAIVALAAASAFVAAKVGAAELGRGSPAPPPPARAGGRARRFRSGVRAVLLAKELRLLARDPELLAIVALQLAYMVPAFGVIFVGGGVSAGRLAAALVLFAGLLTSSLAWLTICGEDAPELVQAAPVPAAALARAKLLAACVPAVLLALPAGLYIAALDPFAGAVALLVAPLAAVAAGLQQLWAGKPQPRRRFKARQKGSLLLAIGEYVMAGAWSAAASLLIAGSAWALAPLAVAVLVLAGAWWLRRAEC